MKFQSSFAFRILISFSLLISPLYGYAISDLPAADMERLQSLNAGPEQLMAATKEYVEIIGDFSDTALKYSSMNDYVVLQAFRDGSELSSYLCHFHADGTWHCSLVEAGEILDRLLQPMFEISSTQIGQWMTDASLVANGDPSVWVWLVVGAATFYLAKKGINKVVHGQYLAPEADRHTHFFQSQHSAEDQSSRVASSMLASIPSLRDIVGQMTERGPPAIPSEVQGVANEQLTKDIKAIVHGLVHAAGSSCSHGIQNDHSGHGPSCGHGGDCGHESHNGHSGHAAHDGPCSHEKEAAQKVLLSGSMIGFAKTMGTDFYREFIRPIGVLAKGAYDTVFSRWNMTQIASLIRVESARMRAETNLPFAIALLASLVGLKAFGEFLETLVVGPYHAFCQVSDAAVLITGMSVWGSYHCLRLAVEYGQLKNIFKPVFWQTMLSSFRQRLRGATATNDTKLFRGGEEGWPAYFLSLRFFSREFKKVLRQKNAVGELSNEQTNQLAGWLGKLNRSLENQSFLKTLEEAGTDVEKELWIQSVQNWLEAFENLVGLTEEWNSEKEQAIESYLEAKTCATALSSPTE